MKRTNESKNLKFAALMAGAALLGLVSQNVLAAGTASGTSIANLAKLSYDVGGTPQDEICSSPTGNSTGNGGTTGTTCSTGTNGAGSTTFVVDNKVNLTVAEVGGAATSVIPNPATGVTSTSTFTVTNNGNTTQDFNLAVAQLANTTVNPFGGALTDNYNVTSCTVTNIVVIGAGSMGTYTASDQHINALTPDSGATVTVTCTTPAAQANNSLAVISLTATARANDAANTLGAALTNDTGVDNPATVQIVFADDAGSDDAALSGSDSARDAYVVQTAVLSVSKVATVLCDPANGSTNPKSIPGSYVQYAITISNTGTAAATLSQITDALQSQLTFDTKLISGAGVATNCAANVQSLSATGFGALRGTGATTYAAPGLAAQDVTAGASVAGQNVTINFATLAGTAYGAANASLAAGDYVTVYFNAFVQ